MASIYRDWWQKLKAYKYFKKCYKHKEFCPPVLHLYEPVKRAGYEQGHWPKPVYILSKEIQLNCKT